MIRRTLGSNHSVTSVTTLPWPRCEHGVLSSSPTSNHRNASPFCSSSMSSSGGTSDILVTPPRTTIALQTMNWDKSTTLKPPNLGISKRFHVHSSSLLKSPLMNKFNRGKVCQFVHLYHQSFTDYTLVLIIHRLSLMRGCGW